MNKNTQCGFTLIELLLVIMLIGIFVGLVIPRVSVLFFGYEFHSAIAKMEKVIRFAQQEAVNKNQYFRFRIDRLDSTYVLEIRSEQEGSPEYSAVEGRFGKVQELPEKCEVIIYTRDTVYFFPDGTTTKAQFSIQYDDKKTVRFTFSGAPFGFKMKYD